MQTNLAGVNLVGKHSHLAFGARTEVPPSALQRLEAVVRRENAQLLTFAVVLEVVSVKLEPLLLALQMHLLGRVESVEQELAARFGLAHVDVEHVGLKLPFEGRAFAFDVRIRPGNDDVLRAGFGLTNLSGNVATQLDQALGS